MSIKTDTETYLPSPVTITSPQVGSSFIDGLSGVKITRLTDEHDGVGFGTTYSIWPTANCDNTRLWVYSSAMNSYWVATFDPATGTRVGQLKPIAPAPGRLFVNYESAWWSGIDPDKIFIVVDAKIYYYRPSTNAYSLVKDLTSHFGADYYFLQSHKSKDDKRFAASGPFGFMVYDVEQDKVLLDVRTTDMNGIALDRTGKWLLYVPDDDHTEYVYNVDIGTREQLKSDRATGLPDFTIGHCDVGAEVIAGNDRWRGGISVRKFSSPHSAPTPFVYAPYWISHHLSMTADDENWALLSTYGEVVGPIDPNKLKDECFQVGIQGIEAGKIRRLFHHRARATDPDFAKRYWSIPKANMSRDGRFVFFTSDMGGSRNDLYVADLASAATTTTKFPSPDGTKSTSIVDSQGATWTFGPEKQTLKDDISVGRGAGVVYKFVSGVVYVLGTDQRTWYRWSDSSWVEIGVHEPGGTVVILPEYVTKDFKETEASRTSLYHQMFEQGYAAYDELSGDKIKFRRFK